MVNKKTLESKVKNRRLKNCRLGVGPLLVLVGRASIVMDHVSLPTP